MEFLEQNKKYNIVYSNLYLFNEKKCTAEKIRNFVLDHKDYNNDSCVGQSISDELIEKILNGAF